MTDFSEKVTRPIRIRELQIGGGAPVVIQSMTTTNPADVEASVAQINDLARAGAQLVRLAVPDMDAARAFAELRKRTTVPLCADIHFNYRLAIAAAQAGADKIRINPGNIGAPDRVKAVADCCRERGIPIRIGVNSGSIEKPLLEKYGVTAEAMVESAAGHIRLLEEAGFTDICLSLKASNVGRTIRANLLAAERFPYPLHLGVTEAGMGQRALLKSAAGIGGLLALGIGDTIRVSMTGNAVQEIAAARQVLEASGRAVGGIEVVSCPTCGRTKVPMEPIVARVEEMVRRIPAQKRLTVAVMGCAVNGPGEAREADIGLAGGDGELLLFVRGQTCGKYEPEEALAQLEARLRVLAQEA